MQAGFVALRPTSQLSKMVSYLDKAFDADKRDAFTALDTWADNIAFPRPATSVTSRSSTKRTASSAASTSAGAVSTSARSIARSSVVADRDVLSPPAATALADRTSSPSRETLVIPGGRIRRRRRRQGPHHALSGARHFFSRHLAS